MSEIVNGIAYRQHIDHECDHGGHGFQRRGLLLGTRGTDPTRIVEHCVLRTRWSRLLALRLENRND